MKEFEKLFKEAYTINAVVQDTTELKHIYDLMKGCHSYLEIGTAEGGSLYVLAHALEPYAKITCVDKDNGTVEVMRRQCIEELAAKDIKVKEIVGNSHDWKTIADVQLSGLYDCVMIDGGHGAFDVVADAMIYGMMARKYIFFHDITMPEVKEAFDWYVFHNEFKNSYVFVKTDNFGFGVIEV